VVSVDCLGGVKGELVFAETVVARLVVRVRGDGVRGIRPPAVRVEKRPWWDFRGVDTDADAILKYHNNDRMDNLMYRSSFLCVEDGEVLWLVVVD